MGKISKLLYVHRSELVECTGIGGLINILIIHSFKQIDESV